MGQTRALFIFLYTYTRLIIVLLSINPDRLHIRHSINPPRIHIPSTSPTRNQCIDKRRISVYGRYGEKLQLCVPWYLWNRDTDQAARAPSSHCPGVGSPQEAVHEAGLVRLIWSLRTTLTSMIVAFTTTVTLRALSTATSSCRFHRSPTTRSRAG